jgi:hypothetical protein
VTRTGSLSSPCELDRLIPPEIVGDEFHRTLERLAARPDVRTILDIGASSGEGSTAALVSGALRNPMRPAIHCIEVSVPRFRRLEERYRDLGFVHCHNVSSVPLDRFPTEAQVDAFRRRVWTRFRFIRRAEVMRWLREDIEYLRRHGLSSDGIRSILAEHAIGRFDLVVIDGSEYTGTAECEAVYGARFIALDDIRTFKNYDNRRRLDADTAYRQIAGSRWLRNGFAVYERVVDPAGREEPA